MSTPPNAKPNELVRARVAVIFVDDKSLAVLNDCFKQFDIECIEATSVDTLSRQKIEGCVVGLDHKDAGTALETLRSSRSNMRAVVYGLEQTPKAGAQYLRYGVSVVLSAPVDRLAVVKAIRSTRALLLNEFRRYVRIPIAIEVAVDAGDRFYSAYTEEISGGGLSLRVPDNAAFPTGTFRVAFSLPRAEKIQISVTVCWKSEQERTVGVRFDPTNSARDIVRNWVDEYLRLS